MNHLVDQYFDSLTDKRVAVLGIGVSNRPLIRMLLARGIHVLACDKTPREKLDAEVLELEQAGAVLHLGEGILTMCGRDVVFRTPGMHPDIPALRQLREKGAELTSEMEVFFEGLPLPHHRRDRLRRQNDHHDPDRKNSGARVPPRLGRRQRRRAPSAAGGGHDAGRTLPWSWSSVPSSS